MSMQTAKNNIEKQRKEKQTNKQEHTHTHMQKYGATGTTLYWLLPAGGGCVTPSYSHQARLPYTTTTATCAY